MIFFQTFISNRTVFYCPLYIKKVGFYSLIHEVPRQHIHWPLEGFCVLAFIT